MTASGRVLRNSFLNLVASVGQKAGQAIVLILVARFLTAEAVGALNLANTYTGILLAFSLWGLDQLLVREVARDREAADRYLGGLLGLRVVLSLVLWGALALVLPRLPYAAESRTVILIMSASIIAGSVANLYQAVWIAFERFAPVTAVALVFSGVRIGGGAAVLWLGRPVVAIAWLFLLAAVGEMAVTVILTYRQGIRPRWTVDGRFWGENLRTATPLIIVSFLLIVEYQFDVVILSLFRSEAEVGIYSTAAALLTLMLFLTRSYQVAIFPVMSRAYHHDREYLDHVYRNSIKYLMVAALPIAIGISYLAEDVITLVYGPEYGAAGGMLSILVWVFLFSAFNVANSRLMIVANEQRMMAYFALLSMSVNIVVSLWLVPRWGGVGTAWARVVAMPFYTIPTFLYAQRLLHVLRRQPMSSSHRLSGIGK